MPSDMRWKRDQSQGTSSYAGSNGSQRRDAAKRDLYNKGLLDSPTEDALNRYYKHKGGDRGQSPRKTQAGVGIGPNNNSSGGGIGPAGTSYDSRTSSSFYGSGNVAGRQQSIYDPTYAPNQVDQNGQPVQGTGSGGINTAGQGGTGQGNIVGAGFGQQRADIQGQQNYSYTNPSEALANVLMDAGIPLSDITVANSLLPMAQSLSNAFGVQQALGGNQGGQGMAGDMFKSFLQHVLSGENAGGGGVYGTIQNALGALNGSVLPEVLRNAMAAGNTGQQITNPFIAQLRSLLTNPDQLLQMRQSLMEPIMGSELASAQASQGALGFLGTRRGIAQGRVPIGTDYIRALTGY
jgi:hypothetical protein